MSDPQPDRLNKKPPRAEPLQPDLPGRGDGAADDAEAPSAASTEAKTAKKLKEQSDAALKNVREGYD